MKNTIVFQGNADSLMWSPVSGTAPAAAIGFRQLPTGTRSFQASAVSQKHAYAASVLYRTADLLVVQSQVVVRQAGLLQGSALELQHLTTKKKRHRSQKQCRRRPEGNHSGTGPRLQWHERLQARALRCATRHWSRKLAKKTQTRQSVKLDDRSQGRQLANLLVRRLAHEHQASTQTRRPPPARQSGRPST